MADAPRRRSPLSIGSGLTGFLSVATLAGVVLAGVGLPAVGMASNTVNDGMGFFDALPGDLEVGNTSQQSQILYSDGTPMARFYYENRINVPLKQVSPYMQHAVIAIEDWRFYEHAGADLVGISRAMMNNLAGRDTQGASTLTQQWVRNVVLDQARARGDDAEVQAQLSPDKGRKIREIKMAIAAEKRYSKDQILENYLNIALFGANQFGVETASQRFFSKHAKDLNVVDSALMAGMIQQPTRFNPLRHPKAAQTRRNVVLAEMLKRGYINESQYMSAKKTPIAKQLKPRKIPNGCTSAGSAAFFCDYVTRVIANDPVFGADHQTRQRLLYRGGLVIRTTLDRRMQAAAQATINRKAGYRNSPGIGMSIVTVQPGTGRILAMAQNRPYDPSDEPEDGKTSLNYNVDQDMGGGMGFQTGSSYKPFTLATWLDSGHSLTESVNSARLSYHLSSFNGNGCIEGRQTGYWRPNNSEGGGGGYMSALQATYNSVNTAYANMASKLSLCQIRSTAEALGVHPAAGGQLEANPASILGTNLIAPMTMAGAFAGFAADGQYCHPIAIDSATPAGRNALKVPSAACDQAIKPDVAKQVNSALQNVLTKGTMRGVGGIGRPAAGKTGTTNDSHETWFVGYTPKQTATAVWVGTPDSHPVSVNFHRIGGQRYGRVYGATIAGASWKEYIMKALQGTPATSFTSASPNSNMVEQVTIPRTSGMSVDQARNTLSDAGFNPYLAGTITSNSPKGTVAGSSPSSGREATRGSTIAIYISGGPAPTPSPSSPSAPASPSTSAGAAPSAAGPSRQSTPGAPSPAPTQSGGN